jgi:hypothetical protein
VILTADHVAAATGCPQRNVAAHWPNILAALEAFGIASLPVQIAAAATVAVETRSFQPIRERRANPAKQPALWATQERYWPSGYYGRGFIQLTGRDNYQVFGDLLGVDLLSQPDLALDPAISARIFAEYFRRQRVAEAAEARDWSRVRLRVNGGSNGWDRFSQLVQQLLVVP